MECAPLRTVLAAAGSVTDHDPDLQSAASAGVDVCQIIEDSALLLAAKPRHPASEKVDVYSLLRLPEFEYSVRVRVALLLPEYVTVPIAVALHSPSAKCRSPSPS